MINFEEPGSEFEFEKIKKTNLHVRIRFATLIVVFSLLFTFVVKNNLDFNLFKTSALGIEEICDPKLGYNWNDEKIVYMEKANEVLDENIQQFELMEGFHGTSVESEAVGFNGNERPVIKIFFEGVVKTSKKIPQRICDYRVDVIFK